MTNLLDQDLSQINYFDIFDIDINKYMEILDINQEIIENKFLKLQSLYHPDNYKKNIYIEKATIISSIINDGYNILQKKLTRNIYLLKIISNIDIDSKSKNIIIDKNFLIEIFELKEEIENININITDKITRNNYLEKIKDKINKDKDILYNNFAKKLYDKNFNKAAEIITKIKYLDEI